MGWADWEAEWQALSEEAYSGLAEWRAAHPRATLAEIEAAVEDRLGRLRARLVERAALASAATDLRERPACPTCGGAVQARGQRKRRLTVPGDQVVELERTYAGCPQCGTGFFPPG
jgi:YgiT-type zinc finger domain-containing protein